MSKPTTDPVAQAALIVEQAAERVDKLGRKIHDQFGNLPAPDEHYRNAAIYIWRQAANEADRMQDEANSAAAALATAAEFETIAIREESVESTIKQTAKVANASAARWREAAAGYRSAAQQHAAQAAAISWAVDMALESAVYMYEQIPA